MSHRRPAAQGWTILSVSVRTRDGPDRLDHADLVRKAGR